MKRTSRDPEKCDVGKQMTGPWSTKKQLASGQLTVCYGKRQLMVDLPIENGDFPMVVCMFTRG